jgi:hypothetical protein
MKEKGCSENLPAERNQAILSLKEQEALKLPREIRSLGKN